MMGEAKTMAKISRYEPPHLHLVDARGDYNVYEGRNIDNSDLVGEAQADALAERTRDRAEAAHNRSEALVAEATQAADMTPAQHVLAQSITLAAAAWLMCFHERLATVVSIQPLGGPEYEVSMRLELKAEQADGDPETIIVHCVLIVEPGKVLHVRVEPARPR